VRKFKAWRIVTLAVGLCCVGFINPTDVVVFVVVVVVVVVAAVQRQRNALSIGFD
jgi:hypothetical protein